MSWGFFLSPHARDFSDGGYWDASHPGVYWAQPQKLFEHLCRKRFREQEPLQLVAAFHLQKIGLSYRFDSFGNDLKSQVTPHHDDRAHDSCVLRRGFLIDLLHKTPVDFDSRERIACQITERCVSRAKIIESNSNTS